MAAALYRLYGLCVHSEIELPAQFAPSEQSPDLIVTLAGRRAIPETVPSGELIALARCGERGYAATRTANGITFRFFRSCDMDISMEDGRVLVYLAPDVETGLAATLLSGTVLALVLVLRGECVLHASCVTIENECLAFAGDTGSGKSTLAALACVRGATLLTDDVLCLDLRPAAVSCRVGPRELRLRDTAAELVERLPRTRVRRTVDERWAVEPAAFSLDDCRLSALVFSQPARTTTHTRIRRLTQKECLLALVHTPRLGGLREPRTLASQLRCFATVARRVPAYAATVPWGPPFDDRVLEPLVETLGALKVEGAIAS